MASLTEKKEKRVRVTKFPLGLAKKKKKGGDCIETNNTFWKLA